MVFYRGVPRPRIDRKLLDEAIALCSQGMTPDQAAEQLRGRIGSRTIYTELMERRKAASAGAGAVQEARVGAIMAPPFGTTLAPERLEQVAALVSELSLEQQQRVAAGMEFFRRVMLAVQRGVCGYPEAKAAVAKELRAVRL